MRSLAETQDDFSDALRKPEHKAPDVLAACNAGSPSRRFDIYRNNVVVGMIEGLRSTFPAIERLVGEAFFKATAKAYLGHEPPTSPLLFRYGKTFGDFLDGFPPAAPVPYLGDVARLEWARLDAYHAADEGADIDRMFGRVGARRCWPSVVCLTSITHADQIEMACCVTLGSEHRSQVV